MAKPTWTTFVPSDGDIILTKVRQGELTPEDAEREAARLGLEPFESRPNPADFDPMAEASWSLVMALAWIMWGTPDAVREVWDSFREKCRVWQYKSWQFPGGPACNGHFLEWKKPADLLDLTLLAFQIPLPMLHRIGNYSAAFQLLRVEAERGKLRATGIPADGETRREIQPFEWIDFDLTQRERQRLKYPVIRKKVVARGLNALGFDDGYDHCNFSVDGMLKTFPALADPVDDETATKQPLNEKLTERTLRGDFPKVVSALKILYPQGIEDVLTNSDVARAVSKHLEKSGAKVPHPKTLTTHIGKFRGK